MRYSKMDSLFGGKYVSIIVCSTIGRLEAYLYRSGIELSRFGFCRLLFLAPAAFVQQSL